MLAWIFKTLNFRRPFCGWSLAFGKFRSILRAQDQQIVNFATNRILTVSPDITVERAIEQFRLESRDLEVVWYLYIIDHEGKLLGLIGLAELVQASNVAVLRDIMLDKVVSLNPENTLKETAEMFERYGYRAIPITDQADKLLGVIPYQDVMKLKHRIVE